MLCLPAAAGLVPSVCAPACTVAGADLTGGAFAPAAVFVLAPGTITWMSIDNLPHTASDLETGCFHATFTPSRAGTMGFAVVDGTLWTDDGPCEAAAQLPDGSFSLDYVCFLHPDMTGTLVIK